MAIPVAVSVTTTATQLLAPNSGRQAFVIANQDDTDTIFIGQDDTVTIANGIPIFAESDRVFDRGFGLYLGAVFAIVGAGTADVRVWEIEGRESGSGG